MDIHEPSLNFLMNRRWSSRIATKPFKPAESALPQKTGLRSTPYSVRNTPLLTEGDSESEIDAEIDFSEYKKHQDDACKTTERRKPGRAAKRFVCHLEEEDEQSKHKKRRKPTRKAQSSIGRDKDDEQFEVSYVRETFRPSKRPVRNDDYDDEADEQSEPEETLESSRAARCALWQYFLAKNNQFQPDKPESIVYKSLADVEQFSGEEPLMRICRQVREADAKWAALKSTLEPWEIADIDENTSWAEHNYHVELEAAETLLQFSAQAHEEAQDAEALLQLHALEADEEHIGLDEYLKVMNTIDRMSFRLARDGGILGQVGVWYDRDDASKEYHAVHKLKMMAVDVDLDGYEELKVTIEGLLARVGGWECSKEAVAMLMEAGELVCQYQIQNLIEQAEDGKREFNWRVPPNEAEQL